MIGPPKFVSESMIDSPLSGGNAAYLDRLYQDYLQDPNSVDGKWREYFARLERHRAAVPSRPASGANYSEREASKQSSVLRLINAYRMRGHKEAKIDPLGMLAQPTVPDLDPEFHGLGHEDLDQVFDSSSLAAEKRMSLRDILALLRGTYCRTIGSEYMHISNIEERWWLQSRLEPYRGRPDFDHEKRKEILWYVSAAEGIERYLHKKYVGQKRFSLEGGESLIPLIHELNHRAGGSGFKEVVIGMAHRGRLNLLVNILGKSPADLFSEFEGKHETEGTGDVKYHQGFSSDIQTEGGPVHLALAFNPSHLEIVSPVVEGSVKARQLRRGDRHGDSVLPVVIHGDASIAGQGVVMETLALGKTRGYGTGGTVHIVVNNQIGFTTSNPVDARSTTYCTDISKMVQAPVFHVNGDDPEAVVFITQLALDYRVKFNKDVVIDLVCYRRHGHNEADEPRVTQPMMYQRISELKTTRELYARSLIDEGVIEQQEADRIVEDYRESLDKHEVVAENLVENGDDQYLVDWTPYLGGSVREDVDTAVSMERLRDLGERLIRLPDGFETHARVTKILEDRRKMKDGELPLDWGMAENLAYAALVQDGHSVRLSGQDSARGTFFHRHAAIHDQKTGEIYIPLRNLFEGQTRFLVINSLLSEEAVMAFEYGYATAEPRTLVIWEAQFGDFANGAQVVIDQFISSGAAKWGRLCGLTLFLPHGYEGQGPEHSSARLERYLQLCADYNQQVCVPTTSAQFFHMIRRQALRRFRRPLIVMTPKSLLRHKLSTSSLDTLANGKFQTLIPEIDPHEEENVTRIVACSGKVYFDLLDARRKHERNDIAIIRVEQLYPFPRDLLTEQCERYPKARRVVWCQEEPRNQGAWYQINHHLRACIRDNQVLSYAGRAASSSPAVGSLAMHTQQQKDLVADALNLPESESKSGKAKTGQSKQKKQTKRK
jgi:2-oxoglutarate dehydrogenase E1 component